MNTTSIYYGSHTQSLAHFLITLQEGYIGWTRKLNVLPTGSLIILSVKHAYTDGYMAALFKTTDDINYYHMANKFWPEWNINDKTPVVQRVTQVSPVGYIDKSDLSAPVTGTGAFNSIDNDTLSVKLLA